MTDIMRDVLHDFVTVYLDDACVYNRTLEEHLVLCTCVLCFNVLERRA
jgi:hypothetical protein